MAPVRNETDAIIIKFREENILAKFGCSKKVVTENDQVFKLSTFIDFIERYNIIVGHSTTYYPQGNGLA